MHFRLQSVMSSSENEGHEDGCAAGRSRRANAGRKMTQLLTEENAEDDFYATTYGGFNEEDDDTEFEAVDSEAERKKQRKTAKRSKGKRKSAESSSEGVSDSADSDIDDSEDDSVDSDLENRAQTDDKADKRKKHFKLGSKKARHDKLPSSKKRKSSNDRPTRTRSSADASASGHTDGPRAVRQSTKMKSEMIAARLKDEELAKTRPPDVRVNRHGHMMRRLTQEELLEEANITEEMNRRSLERFKQYQSEKSQLQSVTNYRLAGPSVKYHSFAVESKDADGHALKTSETLVTFTDKEAFRAICKPKCPKPPAKAICPITGLPAKYFDPISLRPYATVEAFAVLRKLYHHQLNKANKASRSQSQNEATEVTTVAGTDSPVAVS